jgi:hypothetical protein
MDSDTGSIKSAGSPHFDQILPVRQVCRRFRAVANELKFWHDDDFEFSQISPSYDGEPKLPLVETLLTDPHLADCISKKRVWTFRSYREFCIVLERVPVFQNTVSTLRLFWASSSTRHLSFGATDATPFDTMVPELASCSNLTTLQLLAVPTLDLANISEYCPGLEKLFVKNYRYDAPYRQWHGSLQGLSNLQQLSLINLGGAERRQWSPNANVLPSSSIASLTLLVIIDGQPEVTNYIVRSLSTFVHLKHLSLEPLTEEALDKIMRAKFQLTEMKISFGLNLIDEVELRLAFSSAALHGLESLDLSFHEDYDWFTSAHEVVDVVITLQYLQYLKLTRLPMHLSMCRKFSQLVNLKAITWLVTSFHDDIDESEGLYDEEERAERELKVAFQDFVEQPLVSVTIEYASDYHWEYPPEEERWYDGGSD